MKKPIILVVFCAVLFLMPVFSAAPIKIQSSLTQKEKVIPTDEDYDGTFVGGYGLITKVGDELQFEYYGYLAGAYQIKNKYKILLGKIFNLEEEQIGTIGLYNFKSIIIGKIKNIDGSGAPVIGFLITNDQNKFVGRLMSLFGPAPHIWGQFTPN